MSRVGLIVWVCRVRTGAVPAVGPLAAIVTADDGTGDAQGVTIFSGSNPTVPVSNMTPWSLEDGTEWGWLDIPNDRVVPADLLEGA